VVDDRKLEPNLSLRNGASRHIWILLIQDMMCNVRGDAATNTFPGIAGVYCRPCWPLSWCFLPRLSNYIAHKSLSRFTFTNKKAPELRLPNALIAYCSFGRRGKAMRHKPEDADEAKLRQEFQHCGTPSVLTAKAKFYLYKIPGTTRGILHLLPDELLLYPIF
jgi:hypothetical protein